MIQQRKKDALVRNVTQCFDSAIGGGYSLPHGSKSTVSGISKRPTKLTTISRQGGRSVAWLMEQVVVKLRTNVEAKTGRLDTRGNGCM